MSGHSKWSTIKHKKGVQDAKRGKLFSRLIKEITVAARIGGGDVNANPRLRAAVQKAKDNNVPQDNITRAIKRGTGELPGAQYEEITYEGYGPGGVALLIETTTDNSNRTVSELRHILSKYGGNLGSTGCVAWQFERQGLITIPQNAIDEDTLLSIVLDAGALDMSTSLDQYEIITTPEDLNKVKSVLSEKNIEISSAEIVMYPKNNVKVELDTARQLLKLIEAIEDHDDVQNLWTNSDMSLEVMKALEEDVQ